jgi:hypothetical protein
VKAVLAPPSALQLECQGTNHNANKLRHALMDAHPFPTHAQLVWLFFWVHLQTKQCSLSALAAATHEKRDGPRQPLGGAMEWVTS